MFKFGCGPEHVVCAAPEVPKRLHDDAQKVTLSQCSVYCGDTYAVRPCLVMSDDVLRDPRGVRMCHKTTRDTLSSVDIHFALRNR